MLNFHTPYLYIGFAYVIFFEELCDMSLSYWSRHCAIVHGNNFFGTKNIEQKTVLMWHENCNLVIYE